MMEYENEEPHLHASQEEMESLLLDDPPAGGGGGGDSSSSDSHPHLHPLSPSSLLPFAEIAADDNPPSSSPSSLFHPQSPNSSFNSFLEPPSYADAIFRSFDGNGEINGHDSSGELSFPSPSSRSEYIRISVSDPLREQEISNSLVPGSSTYYTYLVTTRTNLPHFNGSEFSVRRRFKEVVSLSDRLSESYRGFFVPLRPDKSVVESQMMQKQEFVEQRMAAVEKYLRRLADHPVIRRSEELKVFLEAEGRLMLAGPTDVAARVLDGVVKLPWQLMGEVNEAAVQPGRGGGICLGLVEEDKEFLERKEKLQEFEQQLSNVSQQAESLVKAQQDIGETMGELGLAFVKLTKFETEEAMYNSQRVRAVDMKNVATAAVKASRLYRELNAQTVKHLAKLHDYLGVMLAVNNAFADRSSAMLTVQTLLSELASLNSRIEKLEENNKNELERLDKERHNDFMSMLKGFVVNQAGYAEKMANVWEMVAEETSGCAKDGGSDVLTCGKAHSDGVFEALQENAKGLNCIEGSKNLKQALAGWEVRGTSREAGYSSSGTVGGISSMKVQEEEDMAELIKDLGQSKERPTEMFPELVNREGVHLAMVPLECNQIEPLASVGPGDGGIRHIDEGNWFSERDEDSASLVWARRKLKGFEQQWKERGHSRGCNREASKSKGKRELKNLEWSIYEKTGAKLSAGAMRDFSEYIMDEELIDMPMEGDCFTWSNGIVLSRLVSDHKPVFLVGGGMHMGPAPFRFENMWLWVEGFKDIVKKWWEGIEIRLATITEELLVLESKEHLPGLSDEEKDRRVELKAEIDLRRLVEVMGCNSSSLPTMHLGLPLGSTFKSKSMWGTVVDRFERRLASWKCQYLSKGGKLTLIKRTLSSMPTYFLSLLTIPKSIALRLEKLMGDFLWKGSANASGINLVTWRVICLPKKGSALGIYDIGLFNKALLGKWIWRFARGEYKLWPLEGYYEGVGGFQSTCIVPLGNGSKILFWHDEWCGQMPLRDKFPEFFALATY
ncbi:sorting nexin 2A [Actinidia rufa]|uniref:Sorting nexin 2A n=1 Tax=Actinidia rufa TaxID=165716 RepID=A0A7J0EAP1_9ERIC|nr:sorting nexin 2A [Actinidia rufa]